MQNKLPNIFIEKSFGIYATKRTASDQIEYVPKERLDLAVKALNEIRDEGRTIDASYRAQEALKELGE